MRLENKMNKWLKFIIKLFPFMWVLIMLIMAIGSRADSGSFVSEIDNLIMTESIHDLIQGLFNDFNLNTPINVFTGMVWSIFGDFNNYIIENVFMLSFDNSAAGVLATILCLFEYWLFIDLIELIFSAFRFIIDVCRSWLDGFYEKNKGGY